MTAPSCARIIGRVMVKKRCIRVAPSSSAAS